MKFLFSIFLYLLSFQVGRAESKIVSIKGSQGEIAITVFSNDKNFNLLSTKDFKTFKRAVWVEVGGGSVYYVYRIKPKENMFFVVKGNDLSFP